MFKAAVVLLFLAIPEIVGDCLAATDPHVPPTARIDCVRGRRGGNLEDWKRTAPEHGKQPRCCCCGLVGESTVIREILDLCDRVAETDATVLISGETGTGKDLVARCIHLHSRRASRRLTPVSCAALPESLLESELFGHKRGSFTGAVLDRKGLIESASGGTLFLDEIDSLTPAMQAKLLRVVEDHCIQRIGGDHDIPVDFRLIAATNSDLEDLVRRGEFRSDLFFRLNVIHIVLPPLRERVSDVPRLARHFRDAFARESGFPVVPFSPESEKWMLTQDWPGNIRQLKHAVERAIVLSRGEITIEPEHLGHGSSLNGNGLDGSLALPLAAGWSLQDLEREYIRTVMDHTDGHKGKAAEILGIDRRTLYRKLESMDSG